MYASKKQPFVTGDVDETVTDEGRKWTEFVIETGLALLNGNCVGGERREITHVDYRSQSVIDYTAINDKGLQIVSGFRICSVYGSDQISDGD